MPYYITLLFNTQLLAYAYRLCLLFGLKLDTAYKHRLHNNILDEVLYTDEVTTSVSAGGQRLPLSNPVHLIIHISVYTWKQDTCRLYVLDDVYIFIRGTK